MAGERDMETLRAEVRETRDMAVRALAVIDSHVSECNRRYEDGVRTQTEFRTQYRNDTEVIHKRISTVVTQQRGLIIAIGAWIITSLITVVVYISYHGLPWNQVN